MEAEIKRMAAVFKALGDENRIRILQILSAGEKCGCRLLEDMNITQPTLSHHMKILCDSGIVNGRKDGKWMYYSVSKEGARAAAGYLEHLVSADTEEGCCCDGSKQ